MNDKKLKPDIFYEELKEDIIVEIPNEYNNDDDNDDDYDDVLPTIKSPYSKGYNRGNVSYTRSIVTLALILLIATLIEINVLKYCLPSLDSADQASIHFPHNFDDIYELNRIFSTYIKNNFFYIYTAFFITYIYLQTFSLPGSMWLSILGGALFPFWLALFTVALCSAIGSSFAYILSSLTSVLIMSRLGDRIHQWKKKISEHKKDLINYLIVLKLAPLPPNWLINISSPHLNVPLDSFFYATIIGVIPPSFIHVQAGSALDKISNGDELELFSFMNVMCLVGVAVAALVPVYLRRRYQVV